MTLIAFITGVKNGPVHRKITLLHFDAFITTANESLWVLQHKKRRRKNQESCSHFSSLKQSKHLICNSNRSWIKQAKDCIISVKKGGEEKWRRHQIPHLKLRDGHAASEARLKQTGCLSISQHRRVLLFLNLDPRRRSPWTELAGRPTVNVKCTHEQKKKTAGR